MFEGVKEQMGQMLAGSYSRQCAVELLRRMSLEDSRRIRARFEQVPTLEGLLGLFPGLPVAMTASDKRLNTASLFKPRSISDLWQRHREEFAPHSDHVAVFFRVDGVGDRASNWVAHNFQLPTLEGYARILVSGVVIDPRPAFCELTSHLFSG